MNINPISASCDIQQSYAIKSLYVTNDDSLEGPITSFDTDTFGFSWTPSIQNCMDDFSSDKISAFNKSLQEDSVFFNPKAVSLMSNSYKINPTSLGKLTMRCDKVQSEWTVERIKETQNSMWADECAQKGLSLMRGGKIKEAIQTLDLAMNMGPKNVRTLVDMGAALTSIREIESSVRCLERALELDPAHDEARGLLAPLQDKLSNARERQMTETRARDTSRPGQSTVSLSSSISAREMDTERRGHDSTIAKLQRLLTSPGDGVSTERKGDRGLRRPSAEDSDSVRGRSVSSGERERYRERESSHRSERKHGTKRKRKHSKSSKRSKKHKKSKTKRKSETVEIPDRSSSSDSTAQETLHPILTRNKHSLWGV
eukprot:CAMPEP_0182422784 /NCGR_PEP_ID=MMETSP1167-20130531/8568_1 /TAXON_ID=2988 /ORGANISM="Mallomonas Sp, Strain CCMP3275" /LENGTH=371 /DNA_ID=CAMNT_0024601139 /DNA_START=145 /DNA_END=1260 /DNA_ORIENTATION=+